MTEAAYATIAIVGSVLLLSLMVEGRLSMSSVKREVTVLMAIRTMLSVAAAIFAVVATYLALRSLVDGVARDLGGVITAALTFTMLVLALNLGKALVASLSSQAGD